MRNLADQGVLTVTDAVITSLQILPASYEGPAGTATRLQALADFSDGSQRDVSREATWTSDDNSIAAVGPTGLLGGATALRGVGATNINVSLDGETATAAVTVTAAELRQLEISPVDEVVVAGVQVSYTATGIYTDGSSEDLTAEVSWGSSDDVVATIGANGIATTLSEGVTEISATYTGINGFSRANDPLSAATNLTVTPAEVVSVQILPGPIEGAAGTQDYLTLEATYSDSSVVDVTELASWSSGSNTIASVVHTGAGAGTVDLNSPRRSDHYGSV